jgi:hypothetical protein
MSTFLQKLVWLVTGGVPRLILTRKEDFFTLSAFRRKRPTNIIRLLRKWPQFASLVNLPAQNPNVIRVPVSQLCAIRLALQAADVPIRIEITPEMMALQPVACPSDFLVTYEWTTEGLTRQFNLPASYFNEGWVVADSKFWQLQITPQDDEWLHLARITGTTAVEFLRTVVPGWKRRNLPVQCRTSYVEEPALQVRIGNVSSEAVGINVRWCNDPDEVRPTPTLAARGKSPRK